MRVGVTLPSMGHLSQPDNLIQAAKAAEQLRSPSGLPTGFCIRSSREPNIRSQRMARCRRSISES